MIIADAKEVASDLEVYLRKAQSGETIVIAIRNEPVAELRPTAGVMSGPRPFGLCAGDFFVADDFDSPPPDDILTDFEGR